MLRWQGWLGILAQDIVPQHEKYPTNETRVKLKPFKHSSFQPMEGAPRGYCATNADVRSFKAGKLHVGVCVAQNGRDYQEDSWLVMSRSLDSPGNGFQLNASSAKNKKKRKKNSTTDQLALEDQATADPTILAVFDGHGGSECSKFLTDKFPSVFEQKLTGVGDGNQTAKEKKEGIAFAVANSLLDIDKMFQTHKFNHGYVGSTATVVAVGACGDISCANTGDSRAVLVRSDRHVLALSSDHSPLTRPDEVQRIDAAGGYLSPGPYSNQAVAYLSGVDLCPRVYHKGWGGRGGLNMTRAVGDSYLKPLVIADPETQHVTVEAGDTFIVVASDGLWDVLTNEEVGDLVSTISCTITDTHQSLPGRSEVNTNDGPLVDEIVRQCSLALVCEAQMRGSSDNVTVVVARLPTIPKQ